LARVLRSHAAVAAAALVVFGSLRVIAQCEAAWRVFPNAGNFCRAVAMHDDGLTNDVYIGSGYAVYRWTSAGWEKLGADFNSFPNDIVSFDGSLYITGSFSEYDGQPLWGLARWNGVSWEAVGGGIGGYAYDAFAFEGKLYVGGGSFTINGTETRGLIVWDGADWSSAGLDFTFSPTGIVTALGEFNGDLVVGGNFYYHGLTPVKSTVVRRNGVFEPLGGGLYYPGGTVRSFATYNNQLYASGQFEAAQGAPDKHIARFDGTNWQPLDGGTNTPVFKILVHDGKLLACGQFTTAGTVPVLGLAAWDGDEWSDPGLTFINHDVQTMCIGPSGELLVGGELGADPKNDGNYQNFQLARFAEGKPEIYTQPNGGTYCNGANFLLFSQAFTDVASGELTWDWSRDAIPLEDGVTDHYSEIIGAHTSAPLILNARAADSGFYQGVAYNECGFTLTYVALVFVCASDVNCDGVSDLGDFFEFFNAWDVSDIHADIDGDGQVDLTDFFAFFNGFDAQC
jgi:hypothetical protein